MVPLAWLCVVAVLPAASALRNPIPRRWSPGPVAAVATDSLPSGLFGGSSLDILDSASAATGDPLLLGLELPEKIDWASVAEEARGLSADEGEDEGLEFGGSQGMRLYREALNGRTSSRDWLHCVATWPKSYVLRSIRGPLVAVTAWSSLVTLWFHCHPGAPARALGTGLHTLVGGALSLLLVFRTNTAYNRYMDGRTIFGRLATATRDLVDVVGLYRDEIGGARADRCAALLKAFPIAVQLHLQGFRFSGPRRGAAAAAASGDPGRKARAVGEEEVLRLFRRVGGGAEEDGIPLAAFVRRLRGEPAVAAALGVPTDLDEAQALDVLHWLKFDRPRAPGAPVSREELAAYYAPLGLWRALGPAGAAACGRVARASNLPLATCSELAAELKAVAYAPDDAYTTRERLYLLKRVADLRATISHAERIVQTPVPLHYARHTSRFLSVWCFTLPLCLAPMVPPAVLPPVVALVSWALLGLREIGLLIEDPFTRSLQLTMVTDTLGREIDETVARHRAR